MPASDDSVLDNIVWNAVVGNVGVWNASGGDSVNNRLAHLATRSGRAARFDPDVSPFAALADDEPESWADLGRLVGPGGRGVLAGGPQSVPTEWSETFRVVGSQMIGDAVEPAGDDPRVVELGPSDALEMFELAARAKPGPFELRTVEFGGYRGVRRDGRLVAMAGERMQPPGWSEISAVCTDESVRGQGLGGLLVRAVATNILRRGATPMLHVANSNTSAIRLYEKLGFRIRGPISFAGFVTPASSD